MNLKNLFTARLVPAAAVAVVLSVTLGAPAPASAAGGGYDPVSARIDLSDQKSLQRGARTFVNYCLSCHSASFMRYNRMGEDLGVSEAQVTENLMFATDKVGNTMDVAFAKADGERWFGVAPPDLSVTAGWHERKKVLVKEGFNAPGGAEKIRLYDLYLHKMEDALTEHQWLASNDFTHADVGLTPYVNRLDMMSMSGMWENGRLPRVTEWWERIKARPLFKSSLLDWCPQDLTNDLRENGAKSWPEVARILDIREAA